MWARSMTVQCARYAGRARLRRQQSDGTTIATPPDAGAVGVEIASGAGDGVRLSGPKCGGQCGAGAKGLAVVVVVVGQELLLTTGRGMQGPPGEI
jgi:hypothetical protein